MRYKEGYRVSRVAHYGERPAEINQYSGYENGRPVQYTELSYRSHQPAHYQDDEVEPPHSTYIEWLVFIFVLIVLVSLFKSCTSAAPPSTHGGTDAGAQQMDCSPSPWDTETAPTTMTTSTATTTTSTATTTTTTTTATANTSYTPDYPTGEDICAFFEAGIDYLRGMEFDFSLDYDPAEYADYECSVDYLINQQNLAALESLCEA